MTKQKTLNWNKIGQYGLISGIVIIYLSLVGMVETFHDRDVIFEYLSLGRALLVIVGIGMGYMIASRATNGTFGQVLMGSVVGGLISVVLVGLLVILSSAVDMREMFVNASPALNEILTFAEELELTLPQNLATGLLALAAYLIAFHIFGGLIFMLPQLLERFVVIGLGAVLIIGMLQELLEVIINRYKSLTWLSDFLFADGLKPVAALVVFVVFGGALALWAAQGEKVRQGMAGLPSTQQRALNWVFISALIIILIFLPQLVGPYISQILVLVGLFILMGLGLNIEIGLAGLLDLGFVGFYAIGAYMVALATSTSEIGLGGGESFTNFWVVIPLAVIVSALSGVFLGIPVLRMRGDYLAIVTLGLAEIIRILVLSDFLRPVLGGAQGILNIPKPVIAGIDFTVKDPGHFYYLIVLGCVIIAFIAYRLQQARIGRNWMALREDEDVAEAMGINLIISKLLAFGIGAAFAGLAGAIFAAQVGSIFPHSFQLLISINVVSLVIIGGVGSIPGVVLGALVLVGLPELLREFAEFRLLIYGALLIVMMLVRPEGLWPSEVTRRELSDEDALDPIPTPASK
ncbi:MAG: hypothetical protein R3264_04745 [Anaerolineae bacterium]|nr:hypothetical protein [Anaerolineae bacterium]